MKQSVCLIISCIICFSLATSCSPKKNTIDYDYKVYGWKKIQANEGVYYDKDKYGTSFSEYLIDYQIHDDVFYGAYYSSSDDESEGVPVALQLYKEDVEHYFIAQSGDSLSLSKPVVFGQKDNPSFAYLDDYSKIKSLSLLSDNEDELCFPDDLSERIWDIYSACQKADEKLESEDIALDNNAPYMAVYIHLKDVKASVQIGILCVGEDGKLYLSNMNYSKCFAFPTEDGIEALKEKMFQ